MKKIFCALGIIALVLAGVVLYKELRENAVTSTLVLNDGTRLNFITVTVGTNHTHRTDLGRFLPLLPQPVLDRIEQWTGNNRIPQILNTSDTNLVVWLEHVGFPNTTTPNASASIVLRKLGSQSAGPDQHLGLWLGAGMSNRVHSVAFRNWPRREPMLECVVMQRNANFENEEIDSFVFPNPWIVSTPSWQPSPGIARTNAGDLTVTLLDFVANVGNRKSQKQENGKLHSSYHPAKSTAPPKAVVQVAFDSPRGTNEVWHMFNADLSDATGNKIGAGSRSGMSDQMEFSPILWPDENAWKLRLHVKRKSGFESHELLTFSKVPLPPPASTNAPNLTNVVMGIESRLIEFRRKPPLDKNRRSWSSRDLSGFKLEHDDLGETNQIDLVSMTLQPTGEELKSSGSGWSNNYHEYNIRSFPTNATHIDLVFSVQKARFVEFLVSPNWITNDYTIPD